MLVRVAMANFEPEVLRAVAVESWIDWWGKSLTTELVVVLAGRLNPFRRPMIP